MKFINTDGMAFIGPGSEWFWTALSGIIFAATFIAIYRQLRQQARASAIEQVEAFEREAGSEQASRSALDILVALRDGTDPADLPEGAALHIELFWENMATLARAGHRDTKVLWQSDASAAQVWWAILAPRVQKERAESGDPRYMENLEWLAGVMAEMDRRAGMPAVTSSAAMARGMDRGITFLQEKIRLAQALRTVILAPPEAVTLAQPTVAAPPA